MIQQLHTYGRETYLCINVVHLVERQLQATEDEVWDVADLLRSLAVTYASGMRLEEPDGDRSPLSYRLTALEVQFLDHELRLPLELVASLRRAGPHLYRCVCLRSS